MISGSASIPGASCVRAGQERGTALTALSSRPPKPARRRISRTLDITRMGAILVLLFLASATACARDEPASPQELSPSDVREIVVEELSENTGPSSPEPQIDASQVQAAVRSAIADTFQPEPGLNVEDVQSIVRTELANSPAYQTPLTGAEVERIIRDVMADFSPPREPATADHDEIKAPERANDIPPRSAAAEYTKFFVANAISKYESEGLAETLSYYSHQESIDGQWYLFIIDANDAVIAHPDATRLGLDLNGWVGTDANGYRFGPEILSATEDGKWVSYVYHNPVKAIISPAELSQVDLKNVWVVRHDDLLFASGWYIDVDQFTKDIVFALVELFQTGGLEGVAKSLRDDPASVLGGVAESAVSYNSSAAVEGEWSMFIVDTTGIVRLHLNPSEIGKPFEGPAGAEFLNIDEEGTWLTSESMRIWAVSLEGWVFGAGWRRAETESQG